jgi:RNA polymerase sigma-70 factor (ECF subfamily)
MEDERRFTALFDRHRRELHVHCYRMLGSFDEAEDAVQEAFLRAWRSRDTARGEFRAWLYRIATNASLDALGRRPENRRTAGSTGAAPISEVTWLQPYPDALLDQVPDPADEPDAVVVARETIELAFLAALQHLPPRQRAVLVLRDVVGWRAADTAELLDMSVAAANSALQRARATLREQLPARRDDWRPVPTAEEQAVLKAFITANEGADLEALAGLLAEHARHTMPPHPHVVEGRTTIIDSWRHALGPDGWGEWHCVPVQVNRQPAMANYLRPGRVVEFPDGSRIEPSDHFVLSNVDVLRIEDGRIAEVTTFGLGDVPGLDLPRRLDLPPRLPHRPDQPAPR